MSNIGTTVEENSLIPRLVAHRESNTLSSTGSDVRHLLHDASVRHVASVETVGVPVHALLALDDKRVAAAVVGMLDAAAKGAVLVTFANPGTALLARRSPTFRQDLDAFDFVLPDGIGMCLAMKWLHGLRARRVSFDTTSLAPAIFDLASERHRRIVLVGGAPNIAETARDRVLEHFPGTPIVGVFDGYGEWEAKLREIGEIDPDIVICGMGSGLQEAFLLRLRDRGWHGWGFTCGGYLDQLHNGINYYPRWIDVANLRWAYRLTREPGRLWRRYLIDYSRFVWLLCAARVGKHRYTSANA